MKKISLSVTTLAILTFLSCENPIGVERGYRIKVSNQTDLQVSALLSYNYPHLAQVFQTCVK